MITQISMIFQCVSYLCNRFLIGVIRDFGTFSEISKYGVDRAGFGQIVKGRHVKGRELKDGRVFVMVSKERYKEGSS